ncbi:hypothetical protein, partial [Candidatus Ichthyocystis sparus]|uniref:hypothetical protein n=1 Tax=Candidatus Ichthyocystis sparus TaxID=1561004 RepID=UPI000B1771C6
SVFSSCWSKVSVSLEDESLSAISCRDFVRVLDVAGILAMALSVRIGGYIRKKGSKGEGVAPVTSVVDLTHSSLPNPQSLPSQASTSTASEVASEVSISSASASLSVQYVDLLGVRLHPDSAKLIYDLFSDIRKSAKMSCSMALGSLLRSVSNGLSMVGQAVIWCRTYKELHLLGFMARFLCLYHSRYRPDFIRSLAGIRVFSSSSDCRLVPLSGEVLLSFLSKLDCSVRGCAESAFNLKWDSIADSVFAGLEDRSLSDVSCKDFINIFNTVSAPVVVFSTYQEYEKKRVMDRRKNSAVAIGEVVAAERGGGRFSAQKSAVALDCASLCAMVLPECALMIKGLFSKVGALASSIYEDMVSKQLPQEISDKLSVTERAIWHRTYMEMCEVGFVSRCLGEYHTEHRPNFVRSISKIQVLSDAKGDLLDFLLGLDCAIRREIESVFSSCWSKVSVSLEDESLSAISC